MFSKVIFYLASVVLLINSLGCGIQLGEQNNQDQIVKISSADCLTQSLPIFKKYFQGETTDLEANSAFQCLQDVFVAFRENIRGEAKDAYTPREIAIFVEQNFFSNTNHFSDSFLNELMYFKVALLGGDITVVKKTEVDGLVDFLKRMTPELVKLNQHMSIITFNWKPDQKNELDLKEQEFLAAKKALHEFTEKMANEFERSGRNYDIDHMANLIKEVALLINSDPKIIKKIEEARPFIKRFKLLLIGGNSGLQGKEWSRLFLTLHEFLFQTLRYEYFLKDLSNNDIETRWDNYQKITADMSKLIETLLDSKESHIISNEELSQLFKELAPVFEEADLSVDLFNQLGELKVAILGDSLMGAQGWSVFDLQKLQMKIPDLFSSLGRLHRLYDTLNEKGLNQKRISEDEFAQLEKDFLIEFRRLSHNFVQSYDLKSLKLLIHGLADGPLKNNIKLPKDFDQLFDVVVSAKETMTGNKGANTSVNDIRMVFDFGASFYLHYVEFELFVKPYDFIQTQFMPALSQVWYKVLQTMDSLLARRQNKIIKTNEIIPLILKLQDSKILETDFSYHSLKSALDGLWSNLLNDPKARLAGYKQYGFTKAALSRLSSETQIFFKTQYQLSLLYRNSVKLDQGKLIEALTRRLSQTNDALEKIGLNEFISLNNKSIALNFDRKKDFLNIGSVASNTYSYYDVTASNISRALGRFFITSYANDMDRVNKRTGLTLEELQSAYAQFQPLAAETGALDPGSTNFINNRFLEANLFLSVSNGDQLANFDELHNLLLHIYSGLNRADVFKKHVQQQCGFGRSRLKSLDQSVEVTCLLNVFYIETEAFSGLPDFLKLKNQYPTEQFLDYGMNLLYAAGHPGGDRVRVSDMDLLPHIIQYVEMVFLTYDTNHDGFLDKDEALRAFPVFQSLIKDLTASYKINDEDLPGVFIYLLKYGKAPKTIPEKLAFLNFIKSPHKWNIQTSRLGIGKIFRFIAESINEKK